MSNVLLKLKIVRLKIKKISQSKDEAKLRFLTTSNQKSLFLTNQKSTTLIASIVTIVNMVTQIATKDLNWPIRIQVMKLMNTKFKRSHRHYRQLYHQPNRLRKNRSKQDELLGVGSDNECHHGQSLIIQQYNV